MQKSGDTGSAATYSTCLPIGGQGFHQIVILMGMDTYPVDRPQMRSNDVYSIVPSWGLGIEMTLTSSPEMDSRIATQYLQRTYLNLRRFLVKKLPEKGPSTAPKTIVGLSRTEPKHINEEVDKFSFLR